jgi:hypothetical protein
VTKQHNLKKFRKYKGEKKIIFAQNSLREKNILITVIGNLYLFLFLSLELFFIFIAVH